MKPALGYGLREKLFLGVVLVDHQEAQAQAGPSPMTPVDLTHGEEMTDNRGSMFCDYTPQCLCMYCGAGHICFDCHEFYVDCYCEREWDPDDLEDHECGEDTCVGEDCP